MNIFLVVMGYLKNRNQTNPEQRFGFVTNPDLPKKV